MIGGSFTGRVRKLGRRDFLTKVAPQALNFQTLHRSKCGEINDCLYLSAPASVCGFEQNISAYYISIDKVIRRY